MKDQPAAIRVRQSRGLGLRYGFETASAAIIFEVAQQHSHSNLVALGVRWLSRRCSTVFYEFAASSKEIPDIIGWSNGVSTLIECKASRADFLRDAQKIVRKKPAAGMGQRRYYLCPARMISVDELPARWGLLIAEKGHVTLLRDARGNPKRSLIAELRFMNAMLRRAQIRIGTRPLSEWLRGENQFEAKRGRPPNAAPIVDTATAARAGS